MRVVLLLSFVVAHPVPGWAQDLAIGNIYNGTPTHEFPAVVGVGILNGDGKIGLCSGTLIAPTAVLTAGHCLASGPVDGIAAVFADGNTRRDYRAAAFIQHPGYTLDRATVGDLGIMILTAPVTDVVPLPLAARAPRPRTSATIVGFGEDGREESGRKRVGTVRLRRCPRVVRVQGGRLHLSKLLCWRPTLETSDTCSGDSGGPLIVNGAVAGVHSGGIAIGTECPGELSYDTNVARYRAWIASVLRQQSVH